MVGIMHFPNGEMCDICVNVNENCCELPFNSMPPIEKYTNGDVMVKCVHYKKRQSKVQPLTFHETVGY